MSVTEFWRWVGDNVPKHCGKCGRFLKKPLQRKRIVIPWIGNRMVCLPCYDRRLS